MNELFWNTKQMISPPEILSYKWLDWCRKCSVPIHEKITYFSSWITPFSHQLQTRALLSGLLPYKPVLHFNPCPRILNRATFLITLLLRTIFKYSGKKVSRSIYENEVNLKINQVKKGLWCNWKMPTLKTREKVGKNISVDVGLPVDAFWNIVRIFHKGETHAHCTHKNELDKLETQGQLEFEHKFEHGLTAATAESWCHHLPTYCVDRGMVDGAPAGNDKEQKVKTFLCQNFEHVGGVLCSSAGQQLDLLCWYR